MLPLDAKFEAGSVVDLEKLLPDCGYKLLEVEFKAVGRLARVACEECESGEATVLKVSGSNVQLELEGVEEFTDREVFLVGVVKAPFDGHLRIQVQELREPEGTPVP